ncbi:hypothetical protein KEJ48_04625 [Candidatus Bathyarchaeota archaeon]|nr:hypothetical protein [Candidatus Bathyarchaeota archaeon]
MKVCVFLIQMEAYLFRWENLRRIMVESGFNSTIEYYWGDQRGYRGLRPCSGEG